ncbi:transmembrane protein 198-like isoform X1 [Narcine bancroftii]|uniref:transmembrane protein 198-like isoform X1 n=1 Tax=Narcine bancroftii TaxID=1343680 RepID=UPI003831669D
MTATPFDFNPVDTGQEAIDGNHCNLAMEREYQLVPSIICAMCCIFGVIYCFFGYRCFKAVMFLCGLMFGSIIIFLLCYKERVLDIELSVEASAGIGLGIGILCGLVTMLVRSVGLFMIGLVLGLLVATVTLIVMEQFYHPHTIWIPLGLLIGIGMLFAVLTLQWQKLFTIISTAVFGGAIMTLTVDYFIELLLLAQYIYERLKIAPSLPICWYSWVILGIWPLLSILGIVVQWKLTAEGYSHTEVIISKRQKRVQLMRIRQKEARRRRRASQAEGTYRRKPYPLKRYAGDILSLSYIQSIRDRQTGTSMSSLNTNIHTVVDVDYDCGSTAPLTATTPVVTA